MHVENDESSEVNTKDKTVRNFYARRVPAENAPGCDSAVFTKSEKK